VSGIERWKQPPAGVPTEADRTRPYVSLGDAAKRRGIDRRTLMRALIKADPTSPMGWARPGPDNLRWYVYEDAIAAHDEAPSRTRPDVTATSETRLRVAQLEAENAELRARLNNASASNLLLLAAHEDLTSATEKFKQALSLYMTPDNIGDLGELPSPPG
jgi:hypothetical protein